MIGAVKVVLTALARAVGVSPQLNGQPLPAAARVLLYFAGWTLMGFGTAAATRNTVLGIVIPLLTALVVEQPWPAH